ncbi:hypothetical protein IW261DRAFT_1420669 [Armillaria novae-zelandiae]|uniref:Uncharacterized protein n=1 Tax=Armillaria novae-zelandiae TaxID=153914 RepID=A0AA39P591_9AGAR|nr:hypothetical protein IW261DRAFT_1420669 [Armillaria novae-zelandiae]
MWKNSSPESAGITADPFLDTRQTAICLKADWYCYFGFICIAAICIRLELLRFERKRSRESRKKDITMISKGHCPFTLSTEPSSSPRTMHRIEQTDAIVTSEATTQVLVQLYSASSNVRPLHSTYGTLAESAAEVEDKSEHGGAELCSATRVLVDASTSIKVMDTLVFSSRWA